MFIHAIMNHTDRILSSMAATHASSLRTFFHIRWKRDEHLVTFFMPLRCLTRKVKPVRWVFTAILLMVAVFPAGAQQSLSDFFPDETRFADEITTPAEFYGFDVGERHLTHDEIFYYLRKLAVESERITLETYARTHEGRPLIMLTITSPENQQSIERIRENHLLLTRPEASANLDLERMPVVVNLGYSVHGNEASGANAAVLMSYYLAAAVGADIEDLLENMVILLDPALNPDGIQRFAGWVNQHRSVNGDVVSSEGREFNEVWPGGRTNHYWFDLNRDWMPVQQPSSRGRIKQFHRWMPNLLTDFHEMGTNSTYFFQPGVDARTNPLTPQRNQDLTMAIAEYHADALDALGELYYSRETFDDFYYGKGSTYPDIFGSVGILFEQASSRGSAQESIHGVLTFQETIHNQVATSLSSMKAAREMRVELHDHMRTFYSEAKAEASRSRVKAWVVGDAHDPARTAHLADLLLHHGIDVYELAQDLTVGPGVFERGDALIIPADQKGYRFLNAVFERRTSFADSVFYDVSSWTLTDAFNLPSAELDASQFSGGLKGNALSLNDGFDIVADGRLVGGRSNYAYLLEWSGYYAPRALYKLQKLGIRAKVATKPFTTATPTGVRTYPQGTILIPVSNQNVDSMALYRVIQEVVEEDGVQMMSLNRGLTISGADLGSPSFVPLTQPQVAMLVGEGVRSYDAGEVWHLFDQRYHMPVTMIDKKDFRGGLEDYNVLIVADGFYGDLSSTETAEIRDWISDGGTLITLRGALRWAADQNWIEVSFVRDASEEATNDSQDASSRKKRAYADYSNDRARDFIGGSIFQAELDLTHPLAYGYHREKLAVFRNTNYFLMPGENPYSTPLRYSDDPLLGGYVSDENLDKLRGTASVMVHRFGSGRVISYVDNPLFRAFWFGTNRLFVNGVFFGDTIRSGTAE